MIFTHKLTPAAGTSLAQFVRVSMASLLVLAVVGTTGPAMADPPGVDRNPAQGPPRKKGKAKGKAPAAVGGNEAIERVKRSTALIETGSGSGSGFVIRPGIVMTNHHVIAKALVEDLRVSFVSLDDTAPPALKPTLLYADPRRDLAILRVDTDRPPLEMVAPGTELSGLAVAVVGNPGDRDVRNLVQINKVTTGTLAAPVRGKGWTYYELRAEAYFGNSGGPVVERTGGKVVGVMQSIAGDGKTKSYCIPYGEATRALDSLPASRGDEPKAARLAAARHYLAYIADKLPRIEKNADLAMQAQLANLLAGGNGSGDITLINEDTGRTFRVSLSELMAELREEHAKAFALVTRLNARHVDVSAAIPSRLRQLLRERIETCGAMRSLANARTNWEDTFRREMAKRKTANDAKARAFRAEYEKFQDHIESTPADKGK
jgi:S1-C subfamily serine protease